MRRRELIALLAVVSTWPLAARSQQTAKIPTIGILSPSRSEDASPNRVTVQAFLAGMRELGYVDGQNIIIERRLSEANADRLREAAAELVKHNVDVIFALSTTAARAAKQVTDVIPIVAFAMADPVDDGLVASLARPGGNVTGTTFLGPELVTKRLELLSQVIPPHSRVAVLWHPRAYGDRTMDGMLKEAEHAAQTLGMQLEFVPANSPEEITGTFSTVTRDRADALCVFPSPMLFAEYGQIVSAVTEKRLPTIYVARDGVELGGLMSYGANLADLARQTAPYVDKIVKGAKPAELPVEQPTKFEFVINLKAAKALGLTISNQMQLLADEVIE
jgi:putative tryptophan/tyrosine transport system substrate-binding protein